MAIHPDPDRKSLYHPLYGFIRITAHADPAIRRTAWLAYTGIPKFVPQEAAMTAERDERERPEVREAALLALS